MYGIVLAAALAVGSAAFLVRQRRAGLRGRTLPVVLALGIVLMPLVSRVFVQLTRYAVRGFGGFVLLSCKPYDYALCGTMLGLLLAAVLAARLTHQRAARVLDVLAPAGLLALAVARAGEVFSDFGWGQLVLDPRGQVFPVAVQDMYGQWHLAVFMLEGALALGLGLWAWRIRGPEGACFARALLWLSLTQILCESLRAETIRWGFVRVQQVACAVFGLALMLAALAKRRRLRGAAAAVGVYLAGVAVVALMEYALDKLPMPQALDYAVMAAALGAMGAAAMRVLARTDEG
ncbi:MAG: prolipoprotein diacylglyceryl transferase family protein [Candidatus Ventricola sp.]